MHKPDLLRTLTGILGPDRCLGDAAARSVYARDASHLTLGRPLAVCLPETVEELARVVRACTQARTAFVARGAGTGLSGGAVPLAGAVVIATARLVEIGPVDTANRMVRVGAGVLNERVSRAAAPCGLHFAPDPSSQSAATIGGNIAENAGGPHTLKHGVTLHHLAQLEWLDGEGRRWCTGRGLACERGIDLLAAQCGAEGTLGIVTAAHLKLTPKAPATATLLAVFAELEQATGAVVDLLGAGMLPAAVEMVDRAMLEAVEEAFRFGFPTDVAAALIIEFDGLAEEVDEDAAWASARLRASGAREVRRAADADERDDLWRCRKKAFAAVGRLAPNYISMDVVVPLAKLPALVQVIAEITREHQVNIATTCHAGDGNVHPGVHFDDRDAASTARAHRAADAIIMAALRMGGSCTGEHGVGLEKMHVIGRQIDTVSAGLMRRIARVFDPPVLSNPAKAFPREAASLHQAPDPPDRLTFQWSSLTVTAPAETPVADIQAEALQRGFWLALGAVLPAEQGPGLGSAGKIGELVDHLLAGPGLLGRSTIRDLLLEIWAETGDGRRFHAGAPVFKNVAGLDLVHLLCGNGGMLARLRGVTLQLRPIPSQAALWQYRLGRTEPAETELDQLLTTLASWETALSAPVCILDGFEVGARSVTVLAAGRDRAWDLGRKESTVSRWARHAGLEFVARERVPFREIARLVLHPAIPVWARRSGDWTFLARRPGQQGWPLQLNKARLIWQGAPALLWTPLSTFAAPESWHADTLIRAGRFTPPPPPDQQVPRHVLAGLKRVFDPTGWLPEPQWLEQALEAGT